MGRPKKSERSADTRQQLLKAAEVAFGEVGYARARLEDIAAAAGIRRSSLLYYFGSKSQLYAEVVAAIGGELRSVLGRAIAEAATPLERIEAVAEALLDFSERRSAAISMFVRELLDSPPSGTEQVHEFVAVLDTLEQLVRTDAAHLIPPGAPVRAALLHIITSQALRVASGELGKQLWGDDVDPRVFIRALMTL
jgi:AcrR family transcriptional regulator